MTDPDDVEAIQLDYALRDLLAVARQHAMPEKVLQEFVLSVVAVCLSGQAPGRPFSWVLLLCARRTAQDARLSL